MWYLGYFESNLQPIFWALIPHIDTKFVEDLIEVIQLYESLIPRTLTQPVQH